MDPILLILVAMTGLVILIKWRLISAQKKLVGKPAPNTITHQHPDGVLYYFYQPLCGPCRQMLPIIEELRGKYPGRVEKFNVANCRELVSTLGISATPTTILIKDNKISQAIIGAKPAQTLEAMLLTKKS